jgi:hypothetical protein
MDMAHYRRACPLSQMGTPPQPDPVMAPANCYGTIPPMTRRQTWHPPLQRWALWAFALALLLKAAVPLLATASAHAQGKTLVEVCTVYGVSTVALDGHDSAPASDHAPAHASDHCALGGLVAVGAPPALPAVFDAAYVSSASERSFASTSVSDACALWVARLKHGPPSLS